MASSTLRGVPLDCGVVADGHGTSLRVLTAVRMLTLDHDVFADGHGTSLRVLTAVSRTQLDYGVRCWSSQPYYVTQYCIGGLEIDE